VGKIRRTEITVETERLLVVSRRGGAFEGWCEGCGRATRLLTAEEAARAAGLSLRALCRLVEAGQLHFTETEGGSLFICPDSLTGPSPYPNAT
jgi:hypothetical protein